MVIRSLQYVLRLLFSPISPCFLAQILILGAITSGILPLVFFIQSAPPTPPSKYSAFCHHVTKTYPQLSPAVNRHKKLGTWFEAGWARNRGAQ